MALPDGCVLDGELLAWDEAANLPRAFTALQTRIQRRKPGAATLRNTPVRVLAYDLLEQDGVDLRELPCRSGAPGSPASSVRWRMRGSSCRPRLPLTTGRMPPHCATSRANAGWKD